MNGFRLPNIDGARLAVPSPVNIGELVMVKEFKGPLIHFTEEQWQLSLGQLEPVKEMPKEAVVLTASALPQGYGILANPFFRCPPGCEPTFGRGIVCPDIGPVGYTPGPDCWFEPQCYCDIDVEIPDLGPRSVPDCGHDNCELRFVPVRIRAGNLGLARTTMLFTCRQVSGDCQRCQLGVLEGERGWSIGCLCQC